MDAVSTLLSGDLVFLLAVVVGSIVISHFLQIAPLITLVAGVAPIVITQLDLPGTPDIIKNHPHYFWVATWVAATVSLVLWLVVRPAIAPNFRGFSPVRFGYWASSLGAFVVAAMLFLDPQLLQRIAPGWRSSVGGVLLGVSLIGVSIAFGRMVRAGLSLVLRLTVSLVLASELVLHKLPHQLTIEDLRRVESVVSADTFRLMLSTWGGMTRFGRGLVGIIWSNSEPSLTASLAQWNDSTAQRLELSLPRPPGSEEAGKDPLSSA